MRGETRFDQLDDDQVAQLAGTIAKIGFDLLLKLDLPDEVSLLVKDIIMRLRRSEKLSGASMSALEERFDVLFEQYIDDLIAPSLLLSIKNCSRVLEFDKESDQRFSCSIEDAIEMLEHTAELWALVNEQCVNTAIEDIRSAILRFVEVVQEEESANQVASLNDYGRIWMTNSRADRGQTALESAWEDARGWLEGHQYKKFLEAMTRDPELIERRNGIGETLLCWFVIENQIEQVRWLLEAGAESSTSDKFGGSAIIHAVQLGYHEMATLLINSGVDLRGVNSDGISLIGLLEAKAPRWTEIEMAVRKQMG